MVRLDMTRTHRYTAHSFKATRKRQTRPRVIDSVRADGVGKGGGGGRGEVLSLHGWRSATVTSADGR